jgi:hypothetical protein
MEHIDLCLSRDFSVSHVEFNVTIYTNHFNTRCGGYNAGAYDLFSQILHLKNITTATKTLRYLLKQPKEEKWNR